MKITTLNHLLLLAAVIIHSGCTEKFETEPEIDQSGRLYEYLLSAGFMPEDISECDDHFILENDWVIPFSEVRLLADQNQYLDVYRGHATEGVDDRQRVSGTSVISMANVENISVFVDPSMASVGGVDYRPWINLALSRWSQSTSGAKINFSYAGSHATADLTIIRNDAGAALVGAPALPTCLMSGSGWPATGATSALARSLFPSSGNAGRFIAVRFNYGGSNSSRVAMLMHEIGHAMGFRHNNSGNESNAGCGVTLQNILLNGTPDNDNSSVMVTPLNDNNTSLSTNDQLAARLLYPPVYTTPNIISVTQYNSTLNKVTISPVSPFYYRVGLEVSRVSDGAVISTTSWNAAGNFVYPIIRPTTPGLYRVRLYGENYGGDFQSNWSAYFNFTI